MANWRALNARVCTDARLVALPEWVQLLYMYMLVQADDYGRLSGNPIEIKLKCIPGSSRNFQEIPTALLGLQEAGLIIWYETGTGKVVQFTDWDDEQPKVLIGKRTKSRHSEYLATCAVVCFQEFPGISSPEKQEKQEKEYRVPKGTLPEFVPNEPSETSLPPPSGGAPACEPELELDSEPNAESPLASPVSPLPGNATIEPPKRKPGKPERSQPTWDTGPETRRLLFEHWVKLFRSDRAKFETGDKRDKAIASMLRHYPPDDLRECLDGYAADEWRRERPERNELATLFRDTAHVEMGIEAHRRPKNGKSATTQRHAGVTRGPSIQRGPSPLGYGDEDRYRKPKQGLELLEA